MNSQLKIIERQQRRKFLADNFPIQGNVNAREAAAFLGIGESTFFRYITKGMIEKAIRFGGSSLWDASYIRSLKNTGFSTKKEA